MPMRLYIHVKRSLWLPTLGITHDKILWRQSARHLIRREYQNSKSVVANYLDAGVFPNLRVEAEFCCVR